MTKSFYFYDLETTGFNPREARIMQFGGQRTDLQLKPVGEPHNLLIKLTEDVVPEPDAILVTGITPQKTIAEGISEAEFLRVFHEEIATPGTIFVGYNSIRFDDEFMRHLHYRNFYDPYEWQWQDDRSRWDLLDVVRMMRALRPEGIKWPFDSSGAPSNRLELITSINGIEHGNAHDALSDVKAVLGLAQLVRKLQPKLFDYLLGMRDKKEVAKLVHAGQPFIYTSGKYSSEWEKTTVVATLAEHPQNGVLVFDLRSDPKDFIKLSPQELAEAWQRRWDEPGIRLPVKTLKFNRSPAIAPLTVLDSSSQDRLQISKRLIKDNFNKLQKLSLGKPVLEALDLMEKRRQAELIIDELDVDNRLYDGFFPESDRLTLRAIRIAKPEEISDYAQKLKDDRLKVLLPLYKARNFPQKLTDSERQIWERFRRHKLLHGKQQSRLAKYFARLGELAEQKGLNSEQRYLLEELQLYGQSILPDTNEV